MPDDDRKKSFKDLIINILLVERIGLWCKTTWHMKQYQSLLASLTGAILPRGVIN